MKAEYIGKCKDKYSDSVYLFYKYRGYEYMICDTRNGYMEMNSLANQHKEEQKRIDHIIEERKSEISNPTDEQFDFDEIWNVLGWD